MLSDFHIHLEHSEYTKAAFSSFVKQAVKVGLQEIGIVEHSHQFKEFWPLYQESRALGGPVAQWYNNKKPRPLLEYLQFVQAMKKQDWPVKINYGLEVCYFPQHQTLIRELLADLPLDYYIGSVHHVYSVPYDLEEISQFALWLRYDHNAIYREYYRLIESLLSSELFDIIGHLDNIKVGGETAGYDLRPTYQKLAKLAKSQKVTIENNTGCHYRYGHRDVGLNAELLAILQENDVKIVTSSDAHWPADVGKIITV